jgi:hypothetical protein
METTKGAPLFVDFHAMSDAELDAALVDLRALVYNASQLRAARQTGRLLRVIEIGERIQDRRRRGAR